MRTEADGGEMLPQAKERWELPKLTEARKTLPIAFRGSVGPPTDTLMSVQLCLLQSSVLPDVRESPPVVLLLFFNIFY